VGITTTRLIKNFKTLTDDIPANFRYRKVGFLHHPMQVCTYLYKKWIDMKYDFIQEYCLSKKGVEEDYKEEWDAIRYSIRGKMFALVGNDAANEPIISVKLEPEYGIELRDRFKDIVPGYYLNKTHWNSLYLNGNVPEETLKRMLDQSYELILNSLSKKTQKEIL
jgi:predicted DNA-binding protein (MmcQ/YjbR family)